MANIHLNRGGNSLGIFSEEEVREGLASARFLGTDLGWREGMPSWLHLAQFPEFAGSTPTGATAGPLASVAPGGTPVPRTGLPWDRRQELGFFTAFFETLKLVLHSPAEAFTAMKTEGGLADPLIYAMIGGSIGWLFYFIFSLFLGSLGMMSDHNVLAGVMGVGMGAIFMLLFIPIALAFVLFLSSAIIHLCLYLVGGATRTFETTFRVVCYSLGSTYPLMIVPVCGGVIASIWGLVAEIIGLGRAHETTTGKAALAVFLPLIVCCGGGVLFAILFGIGGALLNR